MEEGLWKKWNFLREQQDIIITETIRKMPKEIRKNLVLTGGTSLHLFSAKQIFNDEPVRASEDVDFFNTNPKLVENPSGIEEKKIAEHYKQILGNFGFESELNNNIVLIMPHRTKVEFFYDSLSYPHNIYVYKSLKIVHPKALYRIKLNLITQRENVSERDLIDILYLSTKYELPEKIISKEKVDAMLEWSVVENYLTPYGENYLRRDYKKLVESFVKRVVVYEKDQ